jgi:hypothetical protein
MRKPSFSEIKKWAFSASLAALAGIAIQQINALQIYCTAYNIPCNALIVVTSTVLFFVFLGVIEFAWNLIESKKGPSNDKTFVIRMTKPQFERKLDEFINKLDESILKPPNVLLNWRELKYRNKNWDDVNRKHIDDIRDADSIKLLLAPFRGLVLELVENNQGLLVSVNPEGDKESITLARKSRKYITFQHVGFKNIPVNQNAYEDLLRWLDSLEKQSKMYKGTFQE